LAHDLTSLSVFDALKRGVVSFGPVRVSAGRSGRFIALWNVDYLGGTGAESWGAIKLTGKYGLLEKEEIQTEVFNRALQITDRRLQSMLLDSSWKRRSEFAGVSTCIAGRGAAYDEHRVAYVETDLASIVRGVLVIGPAWEDAAFRAAAAQELPVLRSLLGDANALLAEITERPTLEHFSLRVSEALADAPLTTETLGDEPVSFPPLDAPAGNDIYKTMGWTYDDWCNTANGLTPTQLQVLNSSIIERQPIRIVGAAGSGKTLLMMLLAIRQLRRAAESDQGCRIVYIAHNSAMRDKVRARFVELGAEAYLARSAIRGLDVLTLFDYAKEQLGVTDLQLIDADADASKRYQRGVVERATGTVFSSHRDQVDESALLSQLSNEPELHSLFVGLVADEISIAIKGQGMLPSTDSRQYVEAERRLSRLHGLMSPSERALVWSIFLRYNEEISEQDGLLDADDLALSLLGRFRTPLWELRRRSEGYDYVFVDEAQLFNENEKRLFPMMTLRKPYVPIALALDQAQQTRSLTSAGLGTLGVDDLSNQTLHAVHRSSASILKLAFFTIQHTTDLFGSEFPDFTRDTSSVTGMSADTPKPAVVRSEERSAAELAAQIVREMRSRNIRQVCVACFADRYWNSLRDELTRLKEGLRVLEGRGEVLPGPTHPIIVMAKPDAIGGQEFDAVVCVGLEQGVVPPRVMGNEPLAAAVEQQSLREMYLVFTRARTELTIAIGHAGTPTGIVQSAINQGLISDATH
jgi:hypothetical protein